MTRCSVVSRHGPGPLELAGATDAVPVYRGISQTPLQVTAEGVSATEAAGWVASMHGDHRIPTLLKRADRLARTSSPEI